jgi:hypothetical protein
VALRNRIHATIMAFGRPVPVSDPFGVAGRAFLERLDIPRPWATPLDAGLRMVDGLDRDIDAREAEPRRLGADHPHIPLLLTVPGIDPVLGQTNRRRDWGHQPLRPPQEARG